MSDVSRRIAVIAVLAAALLAAAAPAQSACSGYVCPGYRCTLVEGALATMTFDDLRIASSTAGNQVAQQRLIAQGRLWQMPRMGVAVIDVLQDYARVRPKGETGTIWVHRFRLVRCEVP